MHSMGLFHIIFPFFSETDSNCLVILDAEKAKEDDLHVSLLPGSSKKRTSNLNTLDLCNRCEGNWIEIIPCWVYYLAVYSCLFLYCFYHILLSKKFLSNMIIFAVKFVIVSFLLDKMSPNRIWLQKGRSLKAKLKSSWPNAIILLLIYMVCFPNYHFLNGMLS